MPTASPVKQQKEFGFFKRNFFPVYQEEYPKFFYISAMFMLIPFVYALARGNKNSLVAISGGKEMSNMISTLKVFVVLPVVWMFKRAYGLLSDRVDGRKRFTIVIAYFMTFFAFMAFYFYRKNQLMLAPNAELKMLKKQLLETVDPEQIEILNGRIAELSKEIKELTHLWFFDGIGRFIKSCEGQLYQFNGAWYEKLLMVSWYVQLTAPIFEAVQFWPVSLYYVHAEMWGTFVLSVGFWGFVNSISSSEQAKRFYIPFMVGAGLSTASAGYLLSRGISFMVSIALLACAALALAILYNIFERQINLHPASYLPNGKRSEKKRKKKKSFGLKESYLYLKKDPYLRHIASMVLSYGLLIATVEIMYRGVFSDMKAYRILAPLRSDGSYGPALLKGAEALPGQVYEHIRIDAFSVQKFLGLQLMGIGLLQSLFSIFGTRLAVKRSWRFIALITPVIAIAALSPFILVYFFGTQLCADDLWGWLVRKLDWSFDLDPQTQFYIYQQDPITQEESYNLVESGFQRVYWQVAAAYLGVLGGVLIKAFKYVAFDTAKERVFVVAESSVKGEGKALIDSMASRLGKGGISFFNALIFPMVVLIFWPATAGEGSLVSYNPFKMRYMFLMMVVSIISLWIYSVCALSPLYEKRSRALKAGKSVDDLFGGVDEKAPAAPAVQQKKSSAAVRAKQAKAKQSKERGKQKVK